MRKVVAIFALCFILLQLVAISGVYAQTHTLTVMGKVMDRNGHPIKGANVTMIDAYWKAIDTTTSGGNGDFNLTDVTTDSPVFFVSISYSDGRKTYTTSEQQIYWYSTTDSNVI